jgi:hypothetical protein
MHRCLVGLLILCFMILSPVAAQDVTPTPDLNTQFQTLEQTAVSIRGLETLSPVTRGFPTRQDVQEYIEKSLAVSLSDETLNELNAFYVAFDFIPRGTNLRDIFNELYGQQVAGYYDPETKQMNVVSMPTESDKPLGLLDEIVYVHEYTHALQDQHFDLQAYLKEIEDTDNSDLSLARLSLVEGDATFVMNDFAVAETQKDPLGALLEITSSGLEAGNMSLPADTPQVIGDELLFPYLNGEAFVRALMAKGGIDRLNQAYSEPPVSTEQILHPELYLAGEEPLPLILTPSAPDDSWSVASSGVMGEFYLRSYLATQLTLAQATAGAAGWGNGAYAIYQKDDSLAWTINLVWDSSAEQSEFKNLYKEFAEARIGTVVKDGCYIGSPTDAAVVETLCFGENEGHTFITYGPTEDIARTLLESTLHP